MSRLKWSTSLTQYLAVLALAVLASWPVFTHGPVTAVDGPNHFYRLVELNWHVQHGDFYPRWFADINYGLGGPLFNYYAPLSYYVPLLLHIVGFELPTAFLLAFALAVGVSAFGAFTWASAQFQSSLAGLVAATAYVLSPYLYYNILIRGALPEAWGLALAPWLCWSAWLVVAHPGRRSNALLALFYAALVLTHSLSALLFTPILAIYLLSQLGLPSRTNARAWRNIALALALSLGLAAFFLLPFFLENSYVNLARATLDYANAFVSPSDLWAWPVPFDPHLARNPYPISLPLPALLLAVLGLLACLGMRRRSPGATATSFWVLLLLYAAFSLSVSAPLWALIPLGRFVQFPWRLLGPATLLLAWLAGSGVTTLNSRRVWAIALAAVFLYTLTWTYTYAAESQYLPTGTPVDVIQYEKSYPVALGLTYQQEFQPIWINGLAGSTPNLPQYTISHTVPNRLSQMPSDFHVLQEKWFITSAEISYQADRAATLDFDLNYFPGWSATADGQSLVVTPTVPQGRISVTVPAGQHTLSLSLQPTLIQRAANVISLISVLILGFSWLRSTPLTRSSPKALESLSWGWVALLLGLLLVRVTLLDRLETPFYHSQIDALPNPPNPPVYFGDKVALVGLDLASATNLPADSPLTATVYWKALTDLETDYHVSIQLVDSKGNRFGQSDQYPGFVPTGGWRAGQYLPDPHTWFALDGTPPGTYHLFVSVYALQNNTAAPLPAVIIDSSEGEYDLGSITLEPGWLNHPGPLQIVGASTAAQSLTVGDALPFTLAWQTGPTPLANVQAELRLSSPDGSLIYSTGFDPADGLYPSSQWQPNQLIRYPHSLNLPADLPGGLVHVSLALLDSAGKPIGNPYNLGRLTITVPQRSFARPAISHPLNYDFGSLIRLLGYNKNSDGLVLYWQALNIVPTRYAVFVHNLDSTGAFIDGQDSSPSRATTSWLTGEIITDAHPPLTSDYFEVGLYDPITGDRLGEPVSLKP